MRQHELLWLVIANNWPENREYITIRELIALAPQGTAGVAKPASYSYAILVLLCTYRDTQNIIHRDTNAERAINEQAAANPRERNNGIWRQYLNSEVCKMR